MSRIEEMIEVDVPVHSAYNQWTQFEQFPRFMHGVQAVQQVDDTHLHWVTQVDGKTMEWDAELTEQVPDTLVAWRSSNGTTRSGAAHFEALGESRTRIRLEMQSDGVRNANNKAEDPQKQSLQVRQDLERFKLMLEGQGSESGAWRGEIHSGQVTPGAAGEASQQPGASTTVHTASQSGAQTGGAERDPLSARTMTGAGAAPSAWLPHLTSMWEEPFSMMRRMSEEMDRMVERFIGRAPGFSGPSNLPQWTPAIEVSQQGDTLMISADLPGMARQDVKIEVRGEKLIIEGQRDDSVSSGDASGRRSERRFGRFYRMIALPHGAMADSAQATMQNGVLLIQMPVTDMQARGRSLEIGEGATVPQQAMQGGDIESGTESGTAQGATSAQGGTQAPPSALH